MTSSFTTTASFTRVHARYLASKVAADLRLCRIYYDRPSSKDIEDYIEEITELLVGGYLHTFEFGFRANGARIVTCLYTATTGGDLATDDNAGRVFARASVASASFFTYMTYTTKWDSLEPEERDRIRSGLPVERTHGPEPTDGAGYWVSDKTYSVQGTILGRRTFRPN